jgi:caa(3)-type oxidase subunit IV
LDFPVSRTLPALNEGAKVSEAKHEHGWGSYYVVFNALIFLTVVTVGLSYVDVGELISGVFEMIHDKLSFVPALEIGHGANIVLGMIVAIIKASLVLWFFMHQRDEEGLNRFALLFCVGLFFLALFAFSSDFVWLKTYATKEIAAMAVGAK